LKLSIKKHEEKALKCGGRGYKHRSSMAKKKAFFKSSLKKSLNILILFVQHIEKLKRSSKLRDDLKPHVNADL